MAVGLDTSVVLRLLTGEPRPLAEAARTYVDSARAMGKSVGVTDTVVGEAYFALQHHYGMSEPDVRALLRRFLESGVVTVEPEAVLDAFAPRGGAGFLDRLIDTRHRSLGWTSVTVDRKMARALGAELIR